MLVAHFLYGPLVGHGHLLVKGVQRDCWTKGFCSLAVDGKVEKVCRIAEEHIRPDIRDCGDLSVSYGAGSDVAAQLPNRQRFPAVGFKHETPARKGAHDKLVLVDLFQSKEEHTGGTESSN